MDEILKAVNKQAEKTKVAFDAVGLHINPGVSWEENARDIKARLDSLQAENAKLKGDLAFWKDCHGATVDKLAAALLQLRETTTMLRDLLAVFGHTAAYKEDVDLVRRAEEMAGTRSAEKTKAEDCGCEHSEEIECDCRCHAGKTVNGPQACELTCTADPCRHDVESGYAAKKQDREVICGNCCQLIAESERTAHGPGKCLRA